MLTVWPHLFNEKTYEKKERVVYVDCSHLSICPKQKYKAKAMESFIQMKQEGLQSPDEVTWTALISAFARNEDTA